MQDGEALEEEGMDDVESFDGGDAVDEGLFVQRASAREGYRCRRFS